MENKLFTIVNRDNEDSFLTDLSTNPDNFNKKLVFVFGNSENYIVVNGEKFLHKPESAERAPVDLGLPSGTLWAAGNIGAELPWETGKYFAWGETTGYTEEQAQKGEKVFSTDDYNLGTAATISTDLTLEQDAAKSNLGGQWQMPSADYYQELLDYCDCYMSAKYSSTGIKCAIFKSKINGNTLIFPCTGNLSAATTKHYKESFFIWSKSYYNDAKAISFRGYSNPNERKDYFNKIEKERNLGFNIRAIIPGPNPIGTTTGSENSYEYVDLGLSVKWATCNIGATSPEQAGLYFAWGETTGYTADDVTSGVRGFTENEYNAGPAYNYTSTIIKNDNLDLFYDAAHACMGGKWRMPMKVEFDELIYNCTYSWTNDYNGTGVAGCLFTSNINGNSIFIPAAGGCNDSIVAEVGSFGAYWSATYSRYVNSFHQSWIFSIRETIVKAPNSVSKFYSGKTIRAVCDR